ncbi:hypothetical protein N656DRAFT_759242 [Canariomyces notabilis]|uniref:Prp 4 CRoW domain-containing protein n=1 Tax=Canariomyces notabilis TaxID=2074819 RepID=A0AAN6T9B6_9PEZI|nr:hypothetical protein N656DRAFT_759242 [Canariomyces arenarius]
MLAKSFTAMAVLALAANVAAERLPYQPHAMKMSVRELFGVMRRQDTPGYQPEQANCNSGSTCEEACGAGYQTCSSSDSEIHCFNPNAGEICCPNKSGASCEAGYYCTSDEQNETWCCPEGMDLVACAAAYSIPGKLVSQTPPPATSTSASPSSTSQPSTTTSITSEVVSKNSTTTTSSVKTTAKPTGGSSGFAPTNGTTVSVGAPPAPTGTALPTGAASVVGPASAFILLAAGLAALL